MRMKRRIAIVGLGLIGGSLGMRIRQLELGHVIGIDRDYAAATRALDRGAADEATIELERVGDAAVIIVAVPLDQTVAVARAAAGYAAEGAVLSDVGSVKAPLVTQLAGLPRVRFVPGHPMFGTEGQGIEAAGVTLPAGNPYIFTPVASTPHDAVNVMLTLAQDLGMRPILLSPDEHDRLVAEASHLPYLLALLLAHGTDPQARDVAGPAFRDATRVAAAPQDLMAEILRLNRAHILGALDRFSTELTQMREALARGHIQQAVRFR